MNTRKQNFTLNKPFDEGYNNTPQELYDNFKNLRDEIEEIISDYPSYTDWKIEFCVYEDYGDTSTKLLLVCQRPATEQEIKYEQEEKVKQEIRKRKMYEDLKKEFENG